METTGETLLEFDVEGSGTPVVLVHSGLTDSRSWVPILDQLSAGHLVVTYDMAGFGASAAIRDGDHVAHLLSVVRRAANGPAHVIGNSAGGRVAASAALESPDSVRSVTVIGSILCLDQPPPQRSMALSQEHFAARVAGDFDRALELARELWIDDPRQLNRAREVLERQNAAIPDFGFGQLPLEELAVPLHVVVGSLDDELLLAAAQAASRRATGSRLTIVEGARHHTHEDAPAEVAAALLAFLADVDEGRL